MCIYRPSLIIYLLTRNKHNFADHAIRKDTKIHVFEYEYWSVGNRLLLTFIPSSNQQKDGILNVDLSSILCSLKTFYKKIAHF